MKRWGLGIAGCLAVATVYGAWSLWRGQLGSLSLAQEIAAAKREGVPLEPRDLFEPEIPREQNARGPYLAATAHTKAIVHGTKWKSKFDALQPKNGQMRRVTPADRKKLQALIAPLGPAFVSLREASHRPRMVFNRGWRDYHDFEDLPWFKTLIQALVVRGALHHVEGREDLAFRDIEDAARASALLATAQTLEEEFIRSRFEAQILQTLERFVQARPGGKKLPNRIRRVVAALGPPPNPRRMLGLSPWQDRETLAFFAAGGDSCTPGDPLLKVPSIRNSNEAYLISYWRFAFQRIPNDPLDFGGMRFAGEEIDRQFQNPPPLRCLGWPIHEISGLFVRLASGEAKRRVALTAANLLERRDNASPLEDPFGGTIRHRTEKGQRFVYSVGPDRHDDGGIPQKQEEDEKDILWSFPLPSSETVVARR